MILPNNLIRLLHASHFLRLTPALSRQFSASSTVSALGRPSQEKTAAYGYLLESSKPAALLRKQLPLRTGVIGTKKGMTAIYKPTGERIPCTVIQLDRVEVMGTKTARIHGYWAIQVGAGLRQAHNVTKPMLGHFTTCGVSPKRTVHEFRVKGEDGLLPPRTLLKPDHFTEGQYVDVSSITKGKGFAGGMKRHGFKGQPASHGNSLAHRIMGSAGQSQGGGSRVYPGKRMPGRMGGDWHTIQNLKILQVDNELCIVVVAGAVSGPRGGAVLVQDAIKKPPTIPAASAKSP